jgi:FixJ family two-component response regulator
MTDSQPVAAEEAIVFVIDDDPSIRAALDDLLQSSGLRVRSFASPREFLLSGRPNVPACLVLDIKMPEVSGLEFQRALARSNIELPIIFITAHGDIPMSVQAMKAGAIEFLTKPFRDRDLLEAIRAGLAKDRVRQQEAAGLASLRNRYATLTPREQEIMALVAGGRLNKQIAAELGLSLITVKVHRGHVTQKMEADSLGDLVRMADRLGVTAAKG